MLLRSKQTFFLFISFANYRLLHLDADGKYYTSFFCIETFLVVHNHDPLENVLFLFFNEIVETVLIVLMGRAGILEISITWQLLSLQKN